MRTQTALLSQIQGGLIVSCQALEHEPLFGSHIMARMALAAKEGGAVAIRANGASDIRTIKDVGLPVIGIVKRDYPDCDVYITPTLTEVEEVVAAGAEIVAVDSTTRPRPDGFDVTQYIQAIKTRFPGTLVMADISTLAEGIQAAAAGADIVATTMSGYTDYSAQLSGPDFELIAELSKSVALPVIAEGRVRTPEEAAECLQRGAWAVVVGSAITRPQEITKMFTMHLSKLHEAGAL